MKRTYFVLLGAALLLIPHSALGAIELSEISYNPEGTDSGYEWIEILNAGAETISLEHYSFRESGVNHKLKTLQEGGSFALTPKTYAIIADNPIKFQQHFPSFPGLVFDSSFSLINSGELLQILDDSGAVSSEYLYDIELGGNGDGSTLGKISGSFVATNPTPGRANIAFMATNTPNEESDPENHTTSQTENQEAEPKNNQTPTEQPVSSQIVTTGDQPVLTDISVSAGPERIVMRGVPYRFLGSSTPVLKRGNYSWSFGDGSSKKNDVAKHTYQYVGEYIASFTLRYESTNYTDTATITVIDPALSISIIDHESIAIGNDSLYPLEISDFTIQHASSTFTFPEHTFIQPKSLIQISSEVLNIDLDQSLPISLHGPGGTLFSEFNMISQIFKSQQLQSTQRPKESQSIDTTTSTQTPHDNGQAQIVESPQTVYIKVPVHTAPASQGSENNMLEENRPTMNITPSLAEASETTSVSKSGVSIFEILLVLFLTITTLLYAGYKYHLKLQTRQSAGIE